MGMHWKLENQILYAYLNDEWKPARAEDVYCSAFGGVPTDTCLIPKDFEPIREALPDLKFSKFSITPKFRLQLIENRIHIEVYFTKKGKSYTAGFPEPAGPDYAFADGTWCYYSAEYYQMIEVLKAADITDEDITFKQYIHLLNCIQEFPGLTIEDEAKNHFVDVPAIKNGDQPEKLNGKLYPYQSVGFQWLKFITDEECGCILGDEMGLGKTLQVIALLVERKKYKENPSLVVAPLSLLENWSRELQRFAPGLTTLIHHGSDRTGRYKDLLNYDVIITSYGSTITDLAMLSMIEWDLLVLDEAQNIKNPGAVRTVTIKELPRRAAIAVTGTPFENHITDIWSLLDFAVPNCLGRLSEFKSRFTDDLDGAEKVEPFLTALMLRRRVDDVAKDLPEKVIISQPLVMNDDEAVSYEETRREILAGMKGKSAQLAVLTKLRMFCTHPFLLRDGAVPNNPAANSSKYTRLCEIVEEITDRGEKVIIFTSYTGMFNIFKSDLEFRFGIPVDCINGETPAEERQKIVDEFSSVEGPAALILNPRAAGVGLNITAANHVIHYNLEWNPALEDQATARAFRRGQSKTVFVYRLFYAGTVEEVVNEKIESKRDMAGMAVVGTEGNEDSRAMILRALSMSPLKGE